MSQPRNGYGLTSQQTGPQFFSSLEVALFAFTGEHAPGLPRGRTASEKRGRLFFENVGH